MATVYREYERRKEARGEIDFEDLLELAIRLHEDDEQVRATFRARYRAFTVDEYQDVNLLQQTLLELWLGDRDDLCVVGDDYQSIYALHRRVSPVARRSSGSGTPARRSSGSSATTAPRRRCSSWRTGSCRCSRARRRRSAPTRPDGAGACRPPLRDAGGRELLARGRGHAAAGARGRRYSEMAVLARTNARLADFEEAFHDAGIPFQGSSLLERDAARRMLKLLDRDGADRRRRAGARRSRRRRACSTSCPTSWASGS